MKKFILLAIFCFILSDIFSQDNSNTLIRSADDSTMFKWITSDSTYLPVIPLSPLPENYVPAKAPVKQPQLVQPGNFVSMAGFADPPELTHAHIPTSVTVNTGKDVGEIVLESQNSSGSVNYSIPF